MPSIAVLPFQNMSGDPEQDYFCDGMVEEIITGLSRIKWLFVIARNSSFTYRGRAVDVKQVGRELGVRYVLEGSVRKAGRRVRITGQLIEAETGAHLWAERYERPLDDIFAMQDDITLAVVGAIEPSLRAAEVERVRRKRADSLDAYDLFLRALPLADAGNLDEAARAIPLLERALALAPDYVAAHGLLALCLHQRHSRIPGSEAERTAAIAHAHAVLVAGTDDAEALAYAALVITLDEGDAATSLETFERAIGLSPSLAFALGANAVALARFGHSERAIERAEHALRLSPVGASAMRSFQAMAMANFQLERYADAANAARRLTQGRPRFSVGYNMLAVSLAQLGRIDEARQAASQSLALSPNSSISQFTSRYIDYPGGEKYAHAMRLAGFPE